MLEKYVAISGFVGIYNKNNRKNGEQYNFVRFL